MFRAHGRLIILKEFIKPASGAAPDSRSEFELSKSFFAGRQCHIPPRLHWRGPRGYKKHPLWQMPADCLTFLKCRG